MTNLVLSTCNHLGDTVILTAPIMNLLDEHPDDFEIFYNGNYMPVFDGLPVRNFSASVRDCLSHTRQIHLEYRMFGHDDKIADIGNLCEGVTANLARALNVEIPVRRRKPVLLLSENERNGYSGMEDAWVVNTNCQECSSVKMWPYWNELFDMMPDTQFVLTGGVEARDVHSRIRRHENVTDMRGRTTIREFFSLVFSCRGVVSPSSSAVHIAAAFGKPIVCLIGANEPAMLTDYPNTTHLSHECLGTKGTYTPFHGCRHFRTTDARSCEHVRCIDNIPYADCMCEIKPEFVERAIRASRGGEDE